MPARRTVRLTAVRPCLPAGLAGVLAATLLVSLVGCSAGRATDDTPGGTGYVSGAGQGGLLSHRVSVGDVRGRSLDGGTLDLHRFAGRVVVVNFYASWCAPCRAETPLLLRSAAATASRGVVFVGVLFKDSAANGRAFRRAYQETYPSFYDPDGELITAFKGLNPDAVPDTVVLDRAGRLAARYIGPVTPQSNFNAVLDTLAAEPA